MERNWICFNRVPFAIAGIDPHLYEAASMDGASRFKQIYLITLPSIMPVVIIFMILAIGNLVNAGFEDILILASIQLCEKCQIQLMYMLYVSV